MWPRKLLPRKVSNRPLLCAVAVMSIFIVKAIRDTFGSPRVDLGPSNAKLTGSATLPPPSPALPAFISKTFGEKWRLWDSSRDGALFRDEMTAAGIKCEWVVFRPDIQPQLPPPFKTTAPMCVYEGKSDDVYVSESIRSHGRWGECDVLSALVHTSGNELHFEIGANIGACILQVLLTTNATIVAFEPAPSNLYILTSTLMALPSSLRNRVWLFPIGLGDAPMQSTINIDRANRGNSIVGDKGNGHDSQKYLPPIPISVERMDAVVDAAKIPLRDMKKHRGGISSMKIDVQGYECGVVRGMLPSLLPVAVHAVMFENDPSILDQAASPCGATMLHNLFVQPVNNGGANFMVHQLLNHATVGAKLDVAATDVQDLLAIPMGSTLSL